MKNLLRSVKPTLLALGISLGIQTAVAETNAVEKTASTATNVVEQAVSTPKAGAKVFVIPISQPIMYPQLYIVRRGVSEAIAQKADAIVFTMDT